MASGAAAPRSQSVHVPLLRQWTLQSAHGQLDASGEGQPPAPWRKFMTSVSTVYLPSTGSRRPHRADNLEEEIASCEARLLRLEQAFASRKLWDGASAEAQAAALADPSAGLTPLSKTQLVQDWGEVAATLSDLAADALEFGCSRQVPGAMDLYERVNRAIDCMSEISAGRLWSLRPLGSPPWLPRPRRLRPGGDMPRRWSEASRRSWDASWVSSALWLAAASRA
mmetsp:Transcript_14905/g.52301  ORF Transcript_14905/g.52301 Transcript_14905/m.52301 type:complete len:225 (+) Transcript_14905:96-770(+)